MLPMSFQQSSGVTIIPALLHDYRSITQLRDAIMNIPASLNCRLLAVIQGDEKSRHRYSESRAGRDHILIQSELALGKWEAVSRALVHIGTDAQWVIVFDGDGAFEGSELG